MLNVLEELITVPNEHIMWQRIAETFKWGYAKRNEISDFVERPQYAKIVSKEGCRVEKKLKILLERKGYSMIMIDNQIWDKDCLMCNCFSLLCNV